MQLRSARSAAVFVVGVLLTVLAAACGDGGTTAPGGEIGTNGGTLTVFGGAVTIVVPPDAVRQRVTVRVARTITPPANGRLVAGTSYDVGPDELAFFRPATLTVRYDPTQLPNGAVEASLQLYMVSGDGWTLVGSSTVSSASHTVSGTIIGAGTYAIISTTVNRIALSGLLAGGALSTEQSTQLSAILYDESNNVLSGRPIAWATSDAAKATVSETGRVTGVSPGSVTISATSDGKSAATTFTIIPRPTADWSQATEWTTFQGSATHTGYVPVMMDPVVFKELWSRTVADAVNPVTAGDGKVFVTPDSYAGPSRIMRALDARTGTELWSHDFGSVYSVDPPAYANGLVYVQTGGQEDSFLWGFDATNGTVKFRTAYTNQWARWHAPVIIGSSVYAGGGYYGGMYAYDATAGSQRWYVSFSHNGPFAPAVRDGFAYAYSGDLSPKVTVVDAVTGQTTFEIADSRFAAGGWSIDQAPVLGSASNLLVTNGGRLVSFDLEARRIGYELMLSFTGQVTVANGVIYVVNNHRVEARKESDGSLLWQWIPPAGIPTGVMIATKNLLFVSTSVNTYAIDIASQKHVWGYPAAGHLALSAQGLLFIAQYTGKLTAISVQ